MAEQYIAKTSFQFDEYILYSNGEVFTNGRFFLKDDVDRYKGFSDYKKGELLNKKIRKHFGVNHACV